MKVDYSYWQIFYDPDIPLVERIGWAAVSPVVIPLAALGSLTSCTSSPQFGNAVYIPANMDSGSGEISPSKDSSSIDSSSQDGTSGSDVSPEDAVTWDVTNPDVSTISDTPIDIPPQPKLCTSQVTLPENSNVIDITAGETGTCATIKDGSLKCWGKIADIFSSPTPKAMDGFKNIKQASLYLQHLCARDNFGNTWCMGNNIWGQLGNGSEKNTSATAVMVQGAANIMQVATGGFHSCGLNTSGTVFCWGYNVNGQVGLGDTAPSTVTIAQKVLFAPPTPITTIALGSFHSGAIHESGATYGWGHNGVSQLGLVNAGNKVYAPAFIDKSGYRFAAGDDFSCRIDKDCGVSCAGDGGLGQLGGGTTDSKASLTGIKSLKDMAQISANRQHACAVTQAGALYCWGDGVSTPTVVNGLAPVVQVAVGAQHISILDTSGAVFCWGDNAAGQLGGTPTGPGKPIKVENLQ